MGSAEKGLEWVNGPPFYVFLFAMAQIVGKTARLTPTTAACWAILQRGPGCSWPHCGCCRFIFARWVLKAMSMISASSGYPQNGSVARLRVKKHLHGFFSGALPLRSISMDVQAMCLAHMRVVIGTWNSLSLCQVAFALVHACFEPMEGKRSIQWHGPLEARMGHPRQ